MEARRQTGRTLVIAAFLLLGPFSSVSFATPISQTPLPRTQSAFSGLGSYAGLALGSDGAFWTVERLIAGNDRIARIAPSGAVTEFPLPTSSDAISIIAGPDQSLWFLEPSAAKVVQMTTSGSMQEFNTASGLGQSLATGPDGNMWFTADGYGNSPSQAQDDFVGSFDTVTHETKTYDLGQPCGGLGPITAGPDGNLWFTEPGANRVARITVTGLVTEFPLPGVSTCQVATGAITSGTDGNLWFTQSNVSKIRRITPAGEVTEFPLPAGSAPPTWITAAADGRVWFDEDLYGEEVDTPARVAFIMPTGAISEYQLPCAASPGALTFAGDKLWFVLTHFNYQGDPRGTFALASLAPASPPASIARCGGGYVLDGWGGLHPFGIGSAALAPDVTVTGYWPGEDIARSVVMLPSGAGGYVLDGWGGLHPFAVGANPTPPPAAVSGYWQGWDIAKAAVMLPTGSGGYVLDGWGGLHPFAVGANPMPPAAVGSWYAPGQDIARSVALFPDGTGGYVLDGYGGVHPVAVGSGAMPPSATTRGSWPGWDIGRALVLDASGFGGAAGYVVEGWGGAHAWKAADNYALGPDAQATGYWPGTDTARAAASLITDTGGVVLDGWGGLHPYTVPGEPTTADARVTGYWPGVDIARGVTLGA